MANCLFDNAKKNLLNGAINPASDPLYVMLVDNTYTPNQTTHQYRSSITGEVSGTGYTAGGQALSGQSVTADTVNHRGVFTATNASWSGASLTAYGAVIYKHRGGLASADELLGYFDFGGPYTSTAAPFTINWDPTNGILYI